jgi:hypothetical protein
MTPPNDAQRALLRRFSVSFGDDPRIEAAAEEVVAVPYGADLARGFAVAKGLLEAGKRVRLVGVGITLPSVRPNWVHNARGLVLSELWAYRDRSPIRATADLRDEIEAWLDRVLGGAVGDLPARDVFFSSACLRVFESAIVAQPDALGLAAHHPSSAFHVADEQWIGTQMLRAALSATGGTVVGPTGETPRNRLPWRARCLGAGLVALTGTIGEQVRNFVRSTATRKALRLERRRHACGEPDIWVVLISDWYRYSKIVIHSLAIPPIEAGRSVGCLLAGTLVPGERSEANMREHLGADLWTGLGPLRSMLERVHLDQVVGAEDLKALLFVLVESVAASASAVLNIAVAGPRIGDGPAAVDISGAAWPLALLATLDVARALQAKLATERFLASHDVSGRNVVFASLQPAEFVTAGLLMQRKGAVTVELAHGSVGTGEPGARQSRAQKVCVWTQADANALAPLGHDCVVAGMPRALATVKRDADRARCAQRLLLVTNYVAPVLGAHDDRPMEPYQSELLRAAHLARSVLESGGVVRWRPHPADDLEAVKRGLALFAGIELSERRTLAEDVAWADIVVSTPSSALFEVLLVDVPVFLHLPPNYADTPASEFMDDERVFFFAEDFVPKLARCVEAVRQGGSSALAPERAARGALFGPTGSPLQLSDVLDGERRVRDADVRVLR